MKISQPKDQPLRCEVSGDRLVISIGVDTLAFADAERTGLDIINPAGFAGDVTRELMREEEDGSTPLTDLIDEMMEKAANNGSEHQEVEVEVVINGETKKLDSGFIEYDQLAKISGYSRDDVPSITYRKGWAHDSEGIMHPGCDKVRVKKGMVFNVMVTGNA